MSSLKLTANSVRHTLLFGCVCIFFFITRPDTAQAGSPGTLSMSLRDSLIYLGQSTTVTVTLMTGEENIRNMQYPHLTARNIAIGDFSAPLQREHVNSNISSTSYDFTATITPRSAGHLTIGPARLSGEIAARSAGAGGFFGETTQQPVTLESGLLNLTVLALPAGRPADFSGAVGRFSLVRSATPLTLKTGDPVTVSTSITGNAVLTAEMCPEIQSPVFKYYPAQAVLDGTVLRCSQVMIPNSAGVQTIPPARFSFFNTSTARYGLLVSPPLHLNVSVSEHSATTPPSLTTSKISPQLQENHYWLLTVLFVIPFALFLLKFRRTTALVKKDVDTEPTVVSNKETLEHHSSIARRALATSDAPLFYLHIFRGVELVRNELFNRQEALQYSSIADLDWLEERCNAVRYGRCNSDQQEMDAMMQHLDTIQLQLAKL